jgi:hypothetical protein
MAPASTPSTAHTAYAGSPAPAPAPPLRQPVLAPPPNRLVPAILCTLFCFTPFGIIALIKASTVNRLWAQGRHQEAVRAAHSAKSWCVVAAIVWPGSSFLLALTGALWGLSLLR